MTEKMSKTQEQIMIFDDRKELLMLYNALNGTHYDNPEDLSVTTLENAIYMNMKNDVSFVLYDRLFTNQDPRDKIHCFLQRFRSCYGTIHTETF